jgi:hypothetical protein
LIRTIKRGRLSCRPRLLGVRATGLLRRLTGWFGAVETSDATGTEVGVPHLVIADQVDVPETVEAVGQDAASVHVEELQAAHRSVDTEDPDDRFGTHGLTIRRPDATR